jgi:hypothetical protein
MRLFRLRIVKALLLATGMCQSDQPSSQRSRIWNFVIRGMRRTAKTRQRKNWIPISLTEACDIRIFVSAGFTSELFPGAPHEIESKAGRGRYAQALDPPLRFSGDRRLSLIPA